MFNNPLKKFIKSKDAIAKMRVAGKLTAQVLEMIQPHVKPGVTTGMLDQLCHDFIINELHAIPAPLNYNGYPKSICTSINHVVCHGIPSFEKKLKEGDIVNLDISVIKDDYHGDSSIMICVGKTPILAQRLVNVTQECLYEAIKMVKSGISLRDIGSTIEKHARKHGFSVVRDFCGHGIGTEFHEAGFQVLHYDSPESEHFILEPGLTFTIEPMINAGRHEVRVLPDGWTAITKDHSLSAQWEHTILVTETGFEVLTLRSDEKL